MRVIYIDSCSFSVTGDILRCTMSSCSIVFYSAEYAHSLIIHSGNMFFELITRAGILVQVTIYRRLLIGRDGHLDQSEAYDIS